MENITNYDKQTNIYKIIHKITLQILLQNIYR